mmetsp:Transcript_4176/g.13237  ORF Transcript_4176/g.13237 Transcript_4176/m.13237 type:complete len:247 (-) Transcript_4176:1862-2602(-)
MKCVATVMVVITLMSSSNMILYLWSYTRGNTCGEKRRSQCVWNPRASSDCSFRMAEQYCRMASWNTSLSTNLRSLRPSNGKASLMSRSTCLSTQRVTACVRVAASKVLLIFSFRMSISSPKFRPLVRMRVPHSTTPRSTIKKVSPDAPCRKIDSPAENASEYMCMAIADRHVRLSARRGGARSTHLRCTKPATLARSAGDISFMSPCQSEKLLFLRRNRKNSRRRTRSHCGRCLSSRNRLRFLIVW